MSMPVRLTCRTVLSSMSQWWPLAYEALVVAFEPRAGGQAGPAT
jgi:hypothetical protein